MQNMLYVTCLSQIRNWISVCCPDRRLGTHQSARSPSEADGLMKRLQTVSPDTRSLWRPQTLVLCFLACNVPILFLPVLSCHITGMPQYGDIAHVWGMNGCDDRGPVQITSPERVEGGEHAVQEKYDKRACSDSVLVYTAHTCQEFKVFPQKSSLLPLFQF